MASRKLLSYLRKHPVCKNVISLSKVSAEILKTEGEKAELVCDFHAILSWMCKTIQSLEPIGSVGENINEISYRITVFVEALRTVGIEPVFFIDCATGLTPEDLELTLPFVRSNYLHLLSNYATNFFASYHYGVNSINPLISLQMEMTLSLLGVKLIHCLANTTAEVAMYASHSNVCGVLSLNAEYLLFPNCSFIDIKDFDIYRAVDFRSMAMNPNPSEILCAVVTTDLLCRELVLSKDQLIDVAILCGNQYSDNLNNKYNLYNYLKLRSDGVMDFIEFVRTCKYQSSVFREHAKLAYFCESKPDYQKAVSSSKLLYTFPKKLCRCSKQNVFCGWVADKIALGKLPGYFYGIVNYGLYWRQPFFECTSLSQATIHNKLVFIHHVMYSLLGQTRVHEYGRSLTKQFAKIDIECQVFSTPFQTMRQLEYIQTLPVHVKCGLLVLLLTNEVNVVTKRYISSLISAITDSSVPTTNITVRDTLLSLALYIFCQHVTHNFTYFNAIYLSVLLYSVGVMIPTASTEYRIAKEDFGLVTGFSHLLQLLYDFAKLLGLSAELPMPKLLYNPASCLELLTALTHSSFTRSSSEYINSLQDIVFRFQSVRKFHSICMDSQLQADRLNLVSTFRYASQETDAQRGMLASLGYVLDQPDPDRNIDSGTAHSKEDTISSHSSDSVRISDSLPVFGEEVTFDKEDLNETLLLEDTCTSISSASTIVNELYSSSTSSFSQFFCDDDCDSSKMVSSHMEGTINDDSVAQESSQHNPLQIKDENFFENGHSSTSKQEGFLEAKISLKSSDTSHIVVENNEKLCFPITEHHVVIDSNSSVLPSAIKTTPCLIHLQASGEIVSMEGTNDGTTSDSSDEATIEITRVKFHDESELEHEQTLQEEASIIGDKRQSPCFSCISEGINENGTDIQRLHNTALNEDTNLSYSKVKSVEITSSDSKVSHHSSLRNDQTVRSIETSVRELSREDNEELSSQDSEGDIETFPQHSKFETKQQQETDSSSQSDIRDDPDITSSLSVLKHKEKIIQLIKDHRVVCIEGEAGCGKSTMVPQFILDTSNTCKVLVSQPRRVGAVKLAERVSKQRGEMCGYTIGYCIGGQKSVSEHTRIIYCTSGYLLQILTHHPLRIRSYTHIILDEIHERTVNDDLTMLLVRKLAVEIFPHIKIILMSATMQGPLFVKYFQEVFGENKVTLPYSVGVKRFHVDEYFVDELSQMLQSNEQPRVWCEAQLLSQRSLFMLSQEVESKFAQLKHNKPPKVLLFAQELCNELIISTATLGLSVLVFLPGINEILDYFDFLAGELQARKIYEQFTLFILHSQVPVDEQQLLMQAPPNNKVHVILSTNIAESSITIPKLHVVINFGIQRVPKYDYKRKMTCLVRTWCSKAACTQRAGRVGRLFPGKIIHLFPKQFHTHILPDYDKPEMFTASLGKLILQARQIGQEMGIEKPSDILKLAIEPPSLQQMEEALLELTHIGALIAVPGMDATETAELSLLGRFSLHFPLDIDLCRLILYALCFGCPLEGIIIAAGMSLQLDCFTMPSRLLIKDHGTFLNSLLKSMLSRFLFDNKTLSDPMMLCNLFWKWLMFIHCHIDQCKNRKKLAILFSKTYAIQSERFLLFESSINNIAIQVLSLLPYGEYLHKQVQYLVNLTRVGGCDADGQYSSSLPKIQICNNPDVIRALLMASFVDNVIKGVRKVTSFDSQEKKAAQFALQAMHTCNFNPQCTIAVSCLSNASDEAVKELSKAIVPGCKIRTGLIYNLGLIEFQQNISTSGFVDNGMNLFWQFGERRNKWTLEGMSIPFAKPFHPMELAWFRFSPQLERVDVSTWRNRTGFQCKFSSEFCDELTPQIAVAAAIQGTESHTFVKSKFLTIFPSIKDTKLAILLLLAFQPYTSSIMLQLDRSSNSASSMTINSQEIRFGLWQQLTSFDLIIVNKLRRALSEVIASSETNIHLPTYQFSMICKLVATLVHPNIQNLQTSQRIPFPISLTNIMEGSHVYQSVSANQKQFFYPQLRCSLLENNSHVPAHVSYKEDMNVINTSHIPTSTFQPDDHGNVSCINQQDSSLTPNAAPFISRYMYSPQLPTSVATTAVPIQVGPCLPQVSPTNRYPNYGKCEPPISIPCGNMTPTMYQFQHSIPYSQNLINRTRNHDLVCLKEENGENEYCLRVEQKPHFINEECHNTGKTDSPFVTDEHTEMTSDNSIPKKGTDVINTTMNSSSETSLKVNDVSNSNSVWKYSTDTIQNEYRSYNNSVIEKHLSRVTNDDNQHDINQSDNVSQHDKSRTSQHDVDHNDNISKHNSDRISQHNVDHIDSISIHDADCNSISQHDVDHSDNISKHDADHISQHDVDHIDSISQHDTKNDSNVTGINYSENPHELIESVHDLYDRPNDSKNKLCLSQLHCESGSRESGLEHNTPILPPLKIENDCIDSYAINPKSTQCKHDASLSHGDVEFCYDYHGNRTSNTQNSESLYDSDTDTVSNSSKTNYFSKQRSQESIHGQKRANYRSTHSTHSPHSPIPHHILKGMNQTEEEVVKFIIYNGRVVHYSTIIRDRKLRILSFLNDIPLTIRFFRSRLDWFCIQEDIDDYGSDVDDFLISVTDTVAPPVPSVFNYKSIAKSTFKHEKFAKRTTTCNSGSSHYAFTKRGSSIPNDTKSKSSSFGHSQSSRYPDTKITSSHSRQDNKIPSTGQSVSPEDHNNDNGNWPGNGPSLAKCSIKTSSSVSKLCSSRSTTSGQYRNGKKSSYTKPTKSTSYNSHSRSNTPYYSNRGRGKNSSYKKPTTSTHSRSNTPEYSEGNRGRGKNPSYKKPTTSTHSRSNTPEYSEGNRGRGKNPSYKKPTTSTHSRSNTPEYSEGKHSSWTKSTGYTSPLPHSKSNTPEYYRNKKSFYTKSMGYTSQLPRRRSNTPEYSTKGRGTMLTKNSSEPSCKELKKSVLYNEPSSSVSKTSISSTSSTEPTYHYCDETFDHLKSSKHTSIKTPSGKPSDKPPLSSKYGTSSSHSNVDSHHRTSTSLSDD